MKLEKFMFCMTLETIGLVMGFFGAIVSGCALLAVVLAIFMLFMDNDVVPKDPGYTIKKIIFICTFLMNIFYIHVLLLKGIRNKEHKKIKPWLVLNASFIIFTVIVALGVIIEFNHTIPSVIIAVLIAIVAFQIYYVMAVYSLFQNIKETSMNTDSLDLISDEVPQEKNFNNVNIV